MPGLRVPGTNRRKERAICRAMIAAALVGVLVVGVHASRIGVARGAGPATVTLKLWPAGQGKVAVTQNGVTVPLRQGLTPVPGDECVFVLLVADSNPCTAVVAAGTPVTVTATAIAGPDVVLPPDPNTPTAFQQQLPDFTVPISTFVRWTVAGCSGTGPCTFTPDGDTDWVGAIFSPLQLEVGLGVSLNNPQDPLDGIVGAQLPDGSPDPNFKCPDNDDTTPDDPVGFFFFGDKTCHGVFPADSTVVLVATSNQTVTWNPLWCYAQSLSPATCTVVMNNLRTLAAVTFDSHDSPDSPFKISPRVSVLVGGTGHGHVSGSGYDCGSQCSLDKNYQQAVTLQATPDQGSQFAGWQGVCSTDPTCTFSAGSATRVQAVFSLPAQAATTVPVVAPKVQSNGQSKLAARLGTIRVKHRAGHRVLELPLVLDRTARVTIRLSRRTQTILLKQRTLKSGRTVLRFVIPKKLKPGRCQLRVRIVAGDQVRTIPLSVAIGR
jgi:hypothetical protein